MFEMFKVAIRGVSYGMFNYIFLFAAWLVFILVRRLVRMDYYQMSRKKPLLYMVSDIVVQGVIVGILMTLTIVMIGVPLQINDLFLFLVPISMVLSIIKIRFLCISYSAGLLGLVALFCNGQNLLGIKLPEITLHIPSLIIIVAILHMMEGLLVLWTGDRTAVPFLTRKNNQVVMGHVIQKAWPIPLAFLVIELTNHIAGGTIETPSWWPLIQYTGEYTELIYTLLPTVGIISYSTITYNETPAKRSTYSGFSILAYGMILAAIGTLAVSNTWLQIPGVMMMAGLHELIHLWEVYREKRQEPIYNIPKEGIRIMHVIEGGFADKLGLKPGDVIERFNGTVIKDVQHFIQLVKSAGENIILGTKSLHGEKKDLSIDSAKELEKIGIRIIPDKPLIVFPFNFLENAGILSFLRRS
jgi:hypothetical protein